MRLGDHGTVIFGALVSNLMSSYTFKPTIFCNSQFFSFICQIHLSRTTLREIKLRPNVKPDKHQKAE